MKGIVLTILALAAISPILISLTSHFNKEKEITYGQRLQNIAEEINDMKTTWTAEVEKRYFRTSIDQIRGSMGAILEGSPEELEVLEQEEANDIPENFDSRTAWPNCESIKEIRDQANCGSCWAFGAVSAMSDRFCIASGQKEQFRISSEHLLSCCKTCGMGCNGGFLQPAWSYAVHTGLVTGGNHGDTKWCKPYSFPNCDHHCEGRYPPCPKSGPTPKCVKECQSSYKTPFDQDIKKLSKAYAVSSKESQIQTEIMTKGPVEAAFTVYEDFLTYKSGVYQHKSGGKLGGHAIKVLGWGVENGVKYWNVANSWNEDWGDKGFFKILRGSNHCGIEGNMVGGTPVV